MTRDEPIADCFARRENKGGKGMQRTLFAIIALSLPSLALEASEFGGSIFGGASTCAGADTFGPQDAVLGGATNNANSGPCTIPNVGTWSASPSASVDLFGISPEIQGEATTTGTLVLGLTAAAAAGASATYFDTVHLISPRINSTGGVDVIAGDTYNLSVSGSGQFHAASADITFSVISINGEPAPSPATYQQMISETSDGTYSGNISVAFTILACPCSFVFQVDGSAAAGGGSTASFNDPFFLELPPGWTYTLASQEAATAPELSSLVLVASGMVSFCAALRRKLDKTRRVRGG
jgi:hypothetical protein